jgi:hypothetical protein
MIPTGFLLPTTCGPPEAGFDVASNGTLSFGKAARRRYS